MMLELGKSRSVPDRDFGLPLRDSLQIQFCLNPPSAYMARGQVWVSDRAGWLQAKHLTVPSPS